MEAYLLEWANLLLRWLHVIVAIAYIGSSFYFVWLDNSLRPPADEALKAKGVGGELWAVHAGAFYNPQKYVLAPPHLPKDLHWFYWEAYSTWLSGFALFSVLYLFNPRVYLIDKNVADITPTVAVAAAIGFLVVGWLIYDLLCRVLEKQEKLLALMVALYVGLNAWGACHLFSGRAAFLITGATLATIIAANVFFMIIPNQRKMVASMKAKEPVDPLLSQRSKHRSLHNSYVTLPVIFGMISNHYSLTYSGPHNWLVLIAIMAAGALIRHYYIQRHKHRGNPAYPAAAIAILAGEQAAGAVPPFVLDLVGVPPEDLPASLPEAARARIRARGRVPAEALARAYAGAHAVLAPSRYESFGLVYQEALAYGRPVVACAEDASARAFVGAPDAGPLAREATGPALADALRPLLADPALRLAYRARALAAAGRFDRATLARETLALYARAIAAAQARPGGRASVPQSR